MIDEKFLSRLLSGGADQNIDFVELTKLVAAPGFEQRVRGSHHIVSKSGVDEILNLQPRHHLAKAYQVKQVRQVIVRYNLTESR